MPSQKQTNTKPTPKKTRETVFSRVRALARKPGESLTPEERLRLQDAVLEAYADKGTIRAACIKVGIHRSTFYDWQEKDETFSFRFKQAQALYDESLRDEINRRAKEGWLEPLVSAGQRLGTVRKYSDTLLIFHSKMRMPEYREKTQVDMTATVNHQGNALAEIIHLLTPEQRTQLKTWIETAKEQQG